MRHLPHRLVWISPQFGQRNLVASAPGGIGFPQLEHVIIVSVGLFSVMMSVLASGSVIVRLTYILYVSIFAALLFGACQSGKSSDFLPSKASQRTETGHRSRRH